MPDKEVKTIQDLIFYQYAKIIAKSAMKTGDNETAKKNHYGFIKKTFCEQRDERRDVLDIDAIISRGNGLISNPIKLRGADCASPPFHLKKLMPCVSLKRRKIRPCRTPTVSSEQREL